MTSGGLYKPMGINSYSSNKPINSLGYSTKSSDLPSIGKEKSPFKGTYKSLNAYIYTLVVGIIEMLVVLNPLILQNQLVQ